MAGSLGAPVPGARPSGARMPWRPVDQLPPLPSPLAIASACSDGTRGVSAAGARPPSEPRHAPSGAVALCPQELLVRDREPARGRTPAAERRRPTGERSGPAAPTRRNRATSGRPARRRRARRATPGCHWRPGVEVAPRVSARRRRAGARRSRAWRRSSAYMPLRPVITSVPSAPSPAPPPGRSAGAP